MGGASGKVAKLLHGGADQKLFEEIFKRCERFLVQLVAASGLSPG